MTSGSVANVFGIDPELGIIRVARELDLAASVLQHCGTRLAPIGHLDNECLPEKQNKNLIYYRLSSLRRISIFNLNIDYFKVNVMKLE
uniref:Uncharacterized protein n=1 Tax=Trichogramma kaykai TaxID=54128 RepID=A0ABD2WRD8_9HYME